MAEKKPDVRNGMKFKEYKDGTKGLPITFMLKDQPCMKAFEKAVVKSNCGKGGAASVMRMFVLNAFRNGQKF